MLARLARNLLKVLPDGIGFALVKFLAALPKRARLKPRDRHALQRARRLQWGPAGRHVAWNWGRGPVVVLLHGWHGCAAQMAPLAETIAGMGFRCVAPDFTGHGASPGWRIGFDRFIAEIEVFVRWLDQPVHGLVGHSAGALSMMAARRTGAVAAARYVCLNAPRAPYPPIASLRDALDPRRSVLDRCAAFYTGQFPFSAAELEGGEAYRYAGQGRLLVVYDRDDPRVCDGDAHLVASVWPQVEILKTRELGHQGTLWSGEVLAAVSDFLARHEPAR